MKKNYAQIVECLKQQEIKISNSTLTNEFNNAQLQFLNKLNEHFNLQICSDQLLKISRSTAFETYFTNIMTQLFNNI